MTTKIDLSKRYVIVVTCPDEPTGLVSMHGNDDYFTTSKQYALDHAKEMKEAFPSADYKVYELVEVK